MTMTDRERERQEAKVLFFVDVTYKPCVPSRNDIARPMAQNMTITMSCQCSCSQAGLVVCTYRHGNSVSAMQSISQFSLELTLPLFLAYLSMANPFTFSKVHALSQVGALSRQTFCTYRVNTGNWDEVNPPEKNSNFNRLKYHFQLKNNPRTRPENPS